MRNYVKTFHCSNIHKVLHRLLQYTAAVHAYISPRPSWFILGAILGLGHMVFISLHFKKQKKIKKNTKEKNESFQKNQKIKATEIKKTKKKKTEQIIIKKQKNKKIKIKNKNKIDHQAKLTKKSYISFLGRHSHIKQVFLKILQNSQADTCARLSNFI